MVGQHPGAAAHKAVLHACARGGDGCKVWPLFDHRKVLTAGRMLI